MKHYRATEFERKYWYQMQAGSSSGVVPLLLKVNRKIDVELFENAVKKTLIDNSSLRKHFSLDDSGDLVFQLMDCPEGSHVDKVNVKLEKCVLELMKESIDNISFEDCSLKTFLYTNEEASWIGLVFCHIAVDAWSSEKIVEELLQSYEKLELGEKVDLKEISAVNSSYIDNYRRVEDIQLAGTNCDYWSNTLQHSQSIKVRRLVVPKKKNGQNESFVGELPVDLADVSNQFSLKHGVTLNSIYMSCFSLVLTTVTNQRDFIFGIPFVDRANPITDELKDNRAGLLPVRFDSCSGQTAKDHILGSQIQVLEGLANTSSLKGSTPKAVFSTQPSDSKFRLHGQELQVNALSSLVEQPYDILLNVGATQLFWSGNGEKFDSFALSLLHDRFLRVLEQMIANESIPLDAIERVGNKESELIANSPLGDDCGKSIVDLFFDQVHANPHAIAVKEQQGRKLSYQQLDFLTNSLAQKFRRQGLQAGDRVGLLLDRSTEYVIALLACVKLGLVYIPIDPSHPADRNLSILNDASIKKLVSKTALLSREFQQYRVLDLSSEELGELDNLEVEKLDGESLAYIMYTSGSTGKPKGVQVPYRGIVRLVKNTNYIQVEKSDTIPLLSSLSFDASTFEVWGALLNGGCLFVPKKSKLSIKDYEYCFTEGKVTKTFVTTALFNMLLDHNSKMFSSVGTILIGGEVMSIEHANRAQKMLPNSRIVNVYGPTENTTFSTFHDLKGEYIGPVPIGRNIANTGVLVLSEEGKVQPVGEPGQLCLTGKGLAVGYNHNPEKTAEVFVKSPLDGTLMYKTGDYARLLSSRDVEYLGRKDRQVKIRGNRIELSEIEEVMKRNPSVHNAVCQVLTRSANGAILVAYATGSSDINAKEILTWCRKTLTPQMVPNKVVILQELPLNANGKVDFKKLPNPLTSKGVVPNRDWPLLCDKSKIFIKIVKSVLKLDELDPGKSFEQQGGNSLLMTKLIAQVEKKLNIRLQIDQLANHQALLETVELCQKLIKESEPVADEFATEYALDPSICPTGEGPTSFELAEKTVLLTGANGYVGCHLIKAIVDAGVKKVVALVRCANAASGRERLLAAFEKYKISIDYLSAVEVAPGDLGKDQLGIEPSLYSTYASACDVIYHNGAWVNFLYPSQALKNVNVDGTERILKFAVKGKLKPVHYVSTLSVFNSRKHGKTEFAEEFEVTIPPDDHRDGYSVTKWMGENLINQASLRGIPVAIYRLSRIVWDSKSKAGNSDDFFSRLLVGTLACQSIPKAENCFGLGQNLTPTDQVAKAIVNISQKSNCIDKAFHVVSPNNISNLDFLAQLREFDHKMEEIPGEQWEQKMFKQSMSCESHPLFPFATGLGAFNGYHTSTRHFHSDNLQSFLSGTNVDLSVAAEDLQPFLQQLKDDWRQRDLQI